MGGTSSTAADSIDTKVTETKNQNYGLFNVSNESLSSDGINILEIITFLLVFMGAVAFIKSVCARRRKKRLAEMSAHLQGISVDYPGQQPVVRVQLYYSEQMYFSRLLTEISCPPIFSTLNEKISINDIPILPTQSHRWGRQQ